MSNENVSQLSLLKNRRDRILYTYKTHEKAADKIDCIERWRKRASIVLTAVSATTFLVSLAGTIVAEQATNLIISFIALLTTGVSLASDAFDLPNESKNHAAAARELRLIFQEYEALVVDLETGAVTFNEAIEKRDSHFLGQTSPWRSLQGHGSGDGLGPQL
uniref:SLATT domain-containing protein n=1 Tax=Stomatohabitans albus TaxID=3110766 RepID=UPI00300D1BF9